MDLWGLLLGVLVNLLLWAAQHILPVAVNNPFGILASSGDPTPWVDGLGIMGLFVDLPFLFLALSVLLAWKGWFLILKAWTTIVDLLPW